MTTFVLGRRGVGSTAKVSSRVGGLSSIASLREANRRTPVNNNNTKRGGLRQSRKHTMFDVEDGQHTEQQPIPPPPVAPSVTFSELNTYANQDKLRPEGELNNADDEYDEYDEDDEYDSGDEIDNAARLAGNIQHDQKYSFMRSNSPPGGYSQPRQNQRRSGFSVRNNQQQFPKYQQNQSQQESQMPQMPSRPPGHETSKDRKERVRLLARLRRKNAKLPVEQQIKFDPKASLDTLRDSASGASYESRAKTAVLMLRRGTMLIVRLIEAASERYPDWIGDLKGWSENVFLSLEQYDEMLYDIYDEYGDVVQTNPLIVFMFALGSNAMMYSMTKKLMSHPATGKIIHGLADIMNKQKASHDASTTRSYPVPPVDGSPAVPVGLGGSDIDDVVKENNQNREDDGNPLSQILSMFGGDGSTGGGNVDMSKLLSGISDLMGGNMNTSALTGDFRGKPVNDDIMDSKGAGSTAVVVNPMTGVDSDVMSVLRRHQDTEVRVSPVPSSQSNRGSTSATSVRQASPQHQQSGIRPESFRIVDDPRGTTTSKPSLQTKPSTRGTTLQLD